jgi:hypothetical protein
MFIPLSLNILDTFWKVSRENLSKFFFLLTSLLSYDEYLLIQNFLWQFVRLEEILLSHDQILLDLLNICL